MGKRKDAQRPKYLRKGGASLRSSGQSIWDMLRAIEKMPQPRQRIRQKTNSREAG